VEFEFLVNDVLQKIMLDKKDGIFSFSDGENTFEADIQYISPHEISVLIGNRSFQLFLAKDKDCRYFLIGGESFIIKEPTEEGAGFKGGEERTSEGTILIKAPMPGKVIKVCVSEKEAVHKNQTLAIVEAMKMENEIKASADGTIKKIHVSADELVDSEKPLIELDPS
jgi:acetyl/propionyl-CoA carboxylase alpha subunit